MNQKGFTLVEIIVTAAIIGVLTAMALPNFLGSLNRSYAQDSLNNLMSIYAAQQNYNLNNGGMPTNYLTCNNPNDLGACINSSTGLNLGIINNGGTTYTCDAAATPPVCTATKTGSFTMRVTLTSPISIQSSARYCNGTTYNPCCIGGTAGAKCP